jgi:hypothetical protein
VALLPPAPLPPAPPAPVVVPPHALAHLSVVHMKMGKKHIWHAGVSFDPQP